jgi:hypothetical protein
MEITDTSSQYDAVIQRCKDVFVNKTQDYGTAWRILRPSSLTDQIFIKASRIRSIEEKNGISKINEGVDSEFVGIINYAVMALIQLQHSDDYNLEIHPDEAARLYDEQVAITKALMMDKNHDYGEAWRDMRVSSMTDLILMKIIRTKSIEDNKGQTLISEGLEANYMDMLNYAVFALIKINEETS